MIGFTHHQPTKLVFGEGQLRRLRRQAMPGKKALIVTTPGQQKRGDVLSEVLAQLEAAGVAASVYAGVAPNPTTKQAEAAAAQLKAEGCDFLIGLGGGSSIDTAKAAGLLAANDGQWAGFVEGTRFASRGLPLIAIPTTAGSGAEVSPWAVITDPDTGLKVGLGRPDYVPALALVDPALTVTLPREQTMYQAFDALFHASETVINKNGNPMSEMYALEAVRQIAAGLPAALADGSDTEARSHLSLGAVLAGWSMKSCSCHALEHALSGHHGRLPHGAGLMAIAPAWYGRFHRSGACDAALKKLSDALGSDQAYPDALSALMAACGERPSLSAYGVTKEELPALAEEALKTAPLLFFNDPVLLTAEDAAAVLAEAWK